MPSVFEERLFVHLSRFCEVRYCIVRHVGFLMGEGRPAGDPSASVHSLQETLALLRRPMPTVDALDRAFTRLADHAEPIELPLPETQAEVDLFDALTVIFLVPQQSARARSSVRSGFGDRTFELSTAYLAFVRTAHYWTETHPELAYEPDMLACMERHPDLAALLLDVGEATAVSPVMQLRKVMNDLGRAEGALRESETRQRILIEGIPQLVWRAVDDWHWTWASPQWSDYTGQSEADSHGHGWLDPVHPDDRKTVMAIWDGAIERGEFHADYRLRQASGDRYRWFHSRAMPARDEKGNFIEWLGTSTDVDDRRQLQDRQQVLVAELQHRTFNLMGMVRSIADATIRSSAGLTEFKSTFCDRIAALARVQRLLSHVTDEDRVTFDALIRSELEAVGVLQDDERVVLKGPKGVALRSGTVQTFAMALHELTTNAVKYGALKQPGASLAVRWWVEDGDGGRPWLHMDWRETDVLMPLPDEKPRGTGQGRTLIEQALPYQLRAKTDYAMTADGVHCSISLPVSSRTITKPSHVAS